MKQVYSNDWVFYINEKPKFDSDKIGKWMYFFKDRDFVVKICEKAVKKHIVEEAKHNNAEKGVACFLFKL